MKKRSPSQAPQSKNWQARIKTAQCKDYTALQKALKKLNRQQRDTVELLEAQLKSKLEKSCQQVQQRQINLPIIHFPEQLPISERKDEIAELIKNHQVLVLVGETGSGKTTQIPKICLSLGLGCRGLVGHTQPRRIAARTVANRIALELNETLGETVGYQVRFNELTSEKTCIKLMTDGILLAEIQRDRNLSKYEVIIIDEAHERSLNIDFLLGLLKGVIKRRKDLKIIITSATIDVEKFSQHFDQAPIIEVSGRTYPVDVIYNPTETTNRQADLGNAICDTVKDIIDTGKQGTYQAAGDILVFCVGEGDIRELASILRQQNLPIDVLPLYSRLSNKEQNRVFEPSNKRKVILATNVAETSITVPGIGYVIDPGLARISRYNFRAKIQRLPIERISQASANQRKGRCGRIANGICIRLYSEEDFLQRPEFTEPEIVRSNLAAVILQMLQLNINDVDQFPFIDKPDKRLLNDGFKLLHELNCVDHSNKLTQIGRQLNRLPLDPKYARVLYQANQLGCLHEIVVIVSGLSIPDPRERPTEHRQAADEKHRLVQHPQSDFLSLLLLWQQINTQRKTLSNSQFKQYCLKHYWSIARVFEWRDLVGQLKQTVKTLNWQLGELAIIDPPIKPTKKQQTNSFNQHYESIHRALLSGLLSNTATKEVSGEYQAARNRKIHIFPASPLAKTKQQAKWLLANELLETSKLFAHTCAHVKPEWILESAQHLVKYSYSEPHYHKRSGTIKAFRQTSLYGLILRTKEAVNYGPINPTEARQLFIQHALVLGDYTHNKQHQPSFLTNNLKRIEEIQQLEHKARRRDLLISDTQLYDFYNSLVPANITNRNTFEKWYKDTKNAQPALLELNEEQLLRYSLTDQSIAQFPDQLEIQGLSIPVKYRFNPGKTDDGVTLELPIATLQPFPMYTGDWLVPGLLREKCIALIKTLPKPLRKQFAPAANAVDRVLPSLKDNSLPLHAELGRQLHKATGIEIPDNSWQLNKLDAFYLMNYRLIDQDGSQIAESRDLASLKQDYLSQVANSIKVESAPERQQFEQYNLECWESGKLGQRIDYQHQGMTVFAFAMFKVNSSGKVDLLLHEESDYARYYSQYGILQLALKQHNQTHHYLKKEILSNKGKARDKLNLLLLPFFKTQGERGAFTESLIMAALHHSCFADGFPETADQFQTALKQGVVDWVSSAIEIEKVVIQLFEQRYQLQQKINKFKKPTLAIDIVLEDIKEHLFVLFNTGFLYYTSLSQLKHYTRYLKALDTMLDKVANINSANLQTLNNLQTRLDQKVRGYLNSAKQKDPNLSVSFVYQTRPELLQHQVMLFEWRVSLFAQHLRTQFAISEKRIQQHWQSISEQDRIC